MQQTKTGKMPLSPISLGQLLLSGGFIDTGALQQALCTQKWSRRRLGDVLEQRRKLSKTEKQAVLSLQKKLAAHTLAIHSDGSMAPSLQLSLGQLLLDNGEISREQLNSALAEHSRQHRRLGEVLIEQQALTPITLARWLKLQKKLISAATVAACMMAGSASVAADERQQSIWQKFMPNKIFQAGASASQHSWGQQTRHTGEFSIKQSQRNLSELSRSRDGTVTVGLGQKGLNIMKRF